jgi:hypothetical protein
MTGEHMRCEECDAPGEPICDDPQDPWPLCDRHVQELSDRLHRARSGATVSLDEVMRTLNERRDAES